MSVAVRIPSRSAGSLNYEGRVVLEAAQVLAVIALCKEISNCMLITCHFTVAHYIVVYAVFVVVILEVAAEELVIVS